MKTFRSILKNEMTSYICLCKSAGKSTISIESGIRNLDIFLDSIGQNIKKLPRNLVDNWIKQLHPLKNVTIAWNVIVVRQFLFYLRSLGIDAFIPDVPAYRSEYIPYAFTNEELVLLFAASDNLPYQRKSGKKSTIQFPVYLRILYGCGLRAGEALKLRRCDIDFSNGLIKIKCAKGKKDRFVPMNDSLTQLLAAYSRLLEDDEPCGYLFPGRNGHKRDASWAYGWFQRTLLQAGITYKKKKYERAGPCPYSMRHAFIHRAYQQYADSTNHSFSDIMPFLSAYVGHNDADGTDRYFRYDSDLFAEDNGIMDSFIDNLLPED